MHLYEIIDMLAKESSTKKKSEILKENQDNLLLKKYFKATLDPFINYWIRISDIPESIGFERISLEVIDDIIDNLNGRKVTGHASRNYLFGIMDSLHYEDKVLLKNMINHDPNCKVSLGLVNKCWNKLIPEFPVMLADKYDEKTAKGIPEGKDKIIVQKKEDGGRVAIVVDYSGNVIVYSRNGNALETHGVFDETFKPYCGKVFDGELLVIDQTGVQDRKTGNGIFNKAVRNTITLEEALSLHAVLWDVIDYDKWMDGFDETPYNSRLNELISIMENIPSHKASIVESNVVSTHEECQSFYENMIEQGFEGAMMKVATMPWESKRSKFVLKLKETKDATLKCISVTPHSKNSNLIGSIECVSECGKLVVSIGSGLTDEDRKKDPEYFLNKLIDMQYNMLITSKDKTYSMFLPRYRGIRLDQNEADTLEKLL
jgi:ATP-dependent DNA ligase